MFSTTSVSALLASTLPRASVPRASADSASAADADADADATAAAIIQELAIPSDDLALRGVISREGAHGE